MRKLLQQCLEGLADGQFHSGETLAQRLGVTRSAIWKVVKEISALGLPLESSKQEGYRILGGIELLDRETILMSLSPQTHNLLNSMEIQMSLPSTNDYLLSLEGDVHGKVCFAEMQTKARGRRQREWVSPFAAGISFSFAWTYDTCPSDLPSLSLVLGVATLNTLYKVGANDLSLKWPNDIFHQGKKLAGILVEMRGSLEGPCTMIVGIGINVDPRYHSPADLWPDEASSVSLSRNALAAALLDECFKVMKDFPNTGFKSFHADWNACDFLFGKEIQLQQGERDVHGRVLGVDDKGRLRLQVGEHIETFFSGDVTVKNY